MFEFDQFDSVKLKISKEERDSWELYCQELQRLEPAFHSFETAEEKQVRIERLLSVGHYDEFTQEYFSLVTRGTENADFHNEIADDILLDDKFRGCLKIARGHAKTSHNGLVNLLRLVALKKVKFAVIVGKTEKAAIKTLGKIKAHLEFNKRFIADFGEQKTLGDWSEGEFTTADGVTFLAVGRGQSPRGLNNDASFRPDYILLDDIDDDEICRNESRMTDLIEWIYDALINCMDMGRGRFIVIGNLISKNSVVAHFYAKKSMYKRQVNVLDDSRTVVSWYQKYTLQEVLDWIDFLGYRSSEKELFNNPIVVGKVFQLENIIYGEVPAYNKFDLILSYSDPAAANTKTSCNKATSVVGFLGKQIYLIDVFNQNSAMLSMIRWTYDKYEYFTKKETVLEWWMESNFAQYLYIDDYDAEGDERGFTLPLQGDDRPKQNKFARIESIEPFFARGEIIINEELKENEHWLRAKDDLLAFQKGTSTPLDFPDTLEGAISKGRKQIVSNNFEIKFGERELPDGF